MRRRELIGLSPAVVPHAPVDEKRMNEFAFEYNEYVLKLKDSVIDLKQWTRVLAAWERLK